METKEPIIFTHCGQLGDFIYLLPVAAWYHKTHGRKVHFMLPYHFGPFRFVRSLLLKQDFTDGLTLVDYKVQNYGHGGQPYKFNPIELLDDGDRLMPGSLGNYFNFGFRQFPDKFIPAYYAEEYGMDWDRDWVLKLYDDNDVVADCGFVTDGPLYTEHANFPPEAKRFDLTKDVLWNAQAMEQASERHCFFSSMAVIMYFARLPFILYRQPGHAGEDTYFPDRTRYTLKHLPA